MDVNMPRPRSTMPQAMRTRKMAAMAISTAAAPCCAGSLIVVFGYENGALLAGLDRDVPQERGDDRYGARKLAPDNDLDPVLAVDCLGRRRGGARSAGIWPDDLDLDLRTGKERCLCPGSRLDAGAIHISRNPRRAGRHSGVTSPLPGGGVDAGVGGEKASGFDDPEQEQEEQRGDDGEFD